AFGKFLAKLLDDGSEQKLKNYQNLLSRASRLLSDAALAELTTDFYFTNWSQAAAEILNEERGKSDFCLAALLALRDRNEYVENLIILSGIISNDSAAEFVKSVQKGYIAKGRNSSVSGMYIDTISIFSTYRIFFAPRNLLNIVSAYLGEAPQAILHTVAGAV